MKTSKPRMLAPTATGRSEQTTALRIRFMSAAPAGTKPRRAFEQPHAVVAIEEQAPLADLPKEPAWPELADRLDIIVLHMVADLTAHEAWLAPCDHADAPPAITIKRGDEVIQWRPGRAVVQAPAGRAEEIVTALTDFAFYEGELRKMEADVAAREPQAQEDVSRAHKISRADKQHWPRFKQTIDACAQMRLTYARLAPRLAGASRTLAPESRRLVDRLLARAGVQDRVEALSDRLEALEDLYEGATDRVADYRWYRNGHLLEVGIIVLLLIECLMMSSEITLHLREYYRDNSVLEAETKERLAEDNSEEFRATITQAKDGKLTFARTIYNKDTGKPETGVNRTLPVADNVKVAKGKFDRDTREVEAGEAIEGGLKHEMFSKIGAQGVRAILVTDYSNKKVAEVYVFPPTKGGRGQ